MIGIIGVFFNTIAICVILLSEKVAFLLLTFNGIYKIFFLQLWTDFNMLVLNLLMTELTVASIGLPLECVAASQFGWKLGEAACKGFGFLLTFLGKRELTSLGL